MTSIQTRIFIGFVAATVTGVLLACAVEDGNLVGFGVFVAFLAGACIKI